MTSQRKCFSHLQPIGVQDLSANNSFTTKKRPRLLTNKLNINLIPILKLHRCFNRTSDELWGPIVTNDLNVLEPHFLFIRFHQSTTRDSVFHTAAQLPSFSGRCRSNATRSESSNQLDPVAPHVAPHVVGMAQHGSTIQPRDRHLWILWQSSSLGLYLQWYFASQLSPGDGWAGQWCLQVGQASDQAG